MVDFQPVDQPVIFIRFVFNRFKPFIKPVVFQPFRFQLVMFYPVGFEPVKKSGLRGPGLPAGGGREDVAGAPT